MKKRSSGIIVYRKKNNLIEVLLVHPGGPFFKNKNLNSWDFPKGELKGNEDVLMGALREFKEETGLDFSSEEIKKIKFFKEIKRSDGKIITFFIIKKDFGDNLKPKSNFVLVEFPPFSKKFIKIPEIDKMGYFTLEEAKKLVFPYLKELIEELENFTKQTAFD